MSKENFIKPKKYTAPIPIAPGETLKEFIDELEITHKEFSIRLGISEKHLSQLINGSSEISRDIANKLEVVLGIEAMFWLNLEDEYRIALKKNDLLVFDLEEEKIARSIPYPELVKMQLVEATRKIGEKIINLRKFFGVSCLTSIPKVNVAYRKANIAKENEYALAAWIRIAELQARNIETSKFNRNKLIKILPDIRRLTCNKEDNFYGKLVNMLADVGIALVLANHIKGTGVQGVTFLNSKRNKLIIQLSVRGKFADKFWFTLFHEIGHILADKEGNFNYISCTEDEEWRVDELAGNILIPKDLYNEFIKTNNISYMNIVEFANKITIHPCIVIGRLKHDGILEHKAYIDKIPKFEIVSDPIC